MSITVEHNGRGPSGPTAYRSNRDLVMPGCKNFKWREFDENSSQYGRTRIPNNLENNAIRIAQVCQKIRDTLVREDGRQVPVSVNSGYRTLKHHNWLTQRGFNTIENSFHLVAAAADIRRSDGAHQADRLARIARNVSESGAHIYAINERSIHVDLKGSASPTPQQFRQNPSHPSSTNPDISHDSDYDISNGFAEEPYVNNLERRGKSEAGFVIDSIVRENASSAPRIYEYNSRLNVIVLNHSFTTLKDVSNYINVSVSTLRKLNNRSDDFVFSGESLFFPATTLTNALKDSIIGGYEAQAFQEASRNQGIHVLGEWDKHSIKNLVTPEYSDGERATRTSLLNANKEKIKRMSFEGVQYSEAHLIVEKHGVKHRIEFMVSPSDYSVSRSSINVPTRTLGGWFISRLGENPINVSINGHMLDTAYAKEKHSFIEDYKDHIMDRVNSLGQTVSGGLTKLVVEGTEYSGVLSNLTFQKSSRSQFLYTYSFNFLAIDDNLSVRETRVTEEDTSGSVSVVSEGVSNILNESSDSSSSRSSSSKDYQKYYVTAHRLNVRTGPGTDNSVSRVISKGDSVRRYSSRGAWFKISQSKNEWCHSNYLSVTKKTEPKVTTVTKYPVTAYYLNVRTGPGVKYRIKRVLEKGSLVRIFEKKGSWVRVGDGEWLNSNYLDMDSSNRVKEPISPK